ncbi:MAG: hypothetical protein AOA65_2148 [Candidatus Bathyarchaeota archaeon BA1]|nr:MAG: hypothetical protein AOA65_2148 [Candidatus Bathyarchaeota archaeon BA1]
MEALTTGAIGFSDCLTELINQNIVLQGSKNQKMDAEILRTMYGFSSTLGSHSSAKREKPDIEQAVLGLYVTESCIYFLLKRLEVAIKSGKQLKYWVYSPP